MKIYTDNDMEELKDYVHNLFVGYTGMFQPEWKIKILEKIEEIRK